MLWLVLRASFFFITRAGGIVWSKEERWNNGQILRRRDAFFFGAVLNSIEQCEIRLIASRFGFGAQNGVNCGAEWL